MFFALPFPAIDPVIVQIGPLAIRWYALAYIAGLILGWRLIVALNGGPKPLLTRKAIDDLLVWIALGVVLGGRFGYVLFYQPAYYLSHPLDALAIWRGGMSYHGGLLGAAFALYLFARKEKIPFLDLADQLVRAGPIGLFFGRLANFINAELYGRATDVAWAVVFPTGGPQPRHPSQLYEAALEGIALFVVLHLLAKNYEGKARPGLIGGAFLVGYALFRSFCELFREPDVFLGYFVAGTTMGQWLSVPMLLVGLWLMRRSLKPA
ncbi:MAG: prolipoprotein diacylglyceryl transferase [Alphaproteobacteria bacterium]|nr:prolipoprotein diacylglyceryl transferase [Alphaproteobacteria bacterium]